MIIFNSWKKTFVKKTHLGQRNSLFPREQLLNEGKSLRQFKISESVQGALAQRNVFLLIVFAAVEAYTAKRKYWQSVKLNLFWTTKNINCILPNLTSRANTVCKRLLCPRGTARCLTNFLTFPQFPWLGGFSRHWLVEVA